MNYIKKAIIIISILIIIILITIILLLKNKEEQFNQNEYENNGDQIILSEEFANVHNATMYYTVKNCFENFIKITEDNEQTNKYNMLSKKTIDNLNINQTNIYEKINFVKDIEKVNIKKMYVLDRGSIQYYKLQYYTDENVTNEIYVILDDTNMTFAIEMPDENFSIENLQTEIKENNDNSYTYVRISDEQMALNYLEDYNTKALNNPEEAYYLLDEEYRNKRFVGLEDFKKYVEDNKEKLQDAVLKDYSSEYINDSYARKITLCDTYDNYYTIYENAILDYTIMLDNYTIKTEDFNEQYNNLSDEEKAKVDLEQFVSMVNTKDYNNIYSLLEDNFKNTNFSSAELVEKFLKQNYFDYNILEITSIDKSENVYKSKIKLKNNFSKAAEEKIKVIYIYLQEGTDFKIAFEN